MSRARPIPRRRVLGTALLVFFAVGTAISGIHTIGRRASPWPSAWCCWRSSTPSARSLAATSTPRSPSGSAGQAHARQPRRRTTGWPSSPAPSWGGAAQADDQRFGDVTDQTGVLGPTAGARRSTWAGAFVLEVVLTFVFVGLILLVTGPGHPGLRRPGHRPVPRHRPPGRHPAQRHVGEPGPLARPGALRRRRRARARLAVHRRPADRCGARLRRCPGAEHAPGHRGGGAGGRGGHGRRPSTAPAPNCPWTSSRQIPAPAPARDDTGARTTAGPSRRRP